MKRAWRYLRFLLQALVSVGVLVWLSMHLGWSDIWENLRKVSWQLIVGGCAAYVVAQILSAWRWWRMANILRFNVSLGRCIHLYFLGMFYNVFLPSGYGGDLIKLFYMAKHHNPPSKRLSALSIFLDRFTGLIAILFLGFIASIALGIKAEVMGALMALGLVICSAIVVTAVLLVARLKVIPRKGRVVALILYNHASKFISIIFVSVIVQLLNVFIYVAIFKALGVGLSFHAITFGYALVTLATLLPVSIGGLGVRESGWVGILKIFGVPVAAGVSAGILYFAVQTLVGIGGLYSFLRMQLKPLTEDEADECEQLD